MFTLKDVKAAYAKHGFEPCTNYWGNDSLNTACPLTALCFGATDLRLQARPIRTASLLLNVPEAVLCAFVDGVVGKKNFIQETPPLPDYIVNAFFLGQNARVLVCGEDD